MCQRNTNRFLKNFRKHAKVNSKDGLQNLALMQFAQERQVQADH